MRCSPASPTSRFLSVGDHGADALAQDRHDVKPAALDHAPVYRDWRLPEKMTGGIKNPLGAMALYLARNYDVRVTGISLSREQIAVAERRAHRLRVW